jgi:TRAP-type mannitol/chloroaromatic compound transport system substrate-binding protein
MTDTPTTPKATGPATSATRRQFIKTAGATAAVAGTGAIAAPAIKAQAPIRWRFQTYAGPALGAEVTKPIIDHFNKAANGEMEIELYYADQLVPTSELFRALQRGTIDGVHSDDDSMSAPTDVRVFGGYFPLATKHILDVPVLFKQYGLAEIWKEAYDEVDVEWLSAAGQDPCHFITKNPINSLADMDGLRLYTFPTAGQFLAKFGVVPVSIPYEDAEVAVQTGELDGMAWCGATEAYAVGWADVTDHFLTNNISGAWIGSFYANKKAMADLPDHLREMLLASIEAGHQYRNQWYWGGEARLRASGEKLALTSIPQSEWREVEQEADKFWNEIEERSERSAKLVQIFRDYNSTLQKAGTPYYFE